jgi:hypothetical protein
MTNGALRFARYAYPPNALGYCGPADSAALLGYTQAGVADGGLVDLASRFAGAWPYLALIGGANGRADPLDPDVVEAYWIGNSLLEHVPPSLFAAHLDDRFSVRAGAGWADLATLAVCGGRAHHNFHVFAVYPWVGMLRAGFTEDPLRVLNLCRVRWGKVLAVHQDRAEVESSPLAWDGRRLWLGPPAAEVVSFPDADPPIAGDTVSLHWDWLCETLTPRQTRALKAYTVSQLRLVNEALRRPVAAAVLG